MNKAEHAQEEAETTHDRWEKAERTVNEIWQSNGELLERLRNLEGQILGHAQAEAQPWPMSSMRRARQEGRATYETQQLASKPGHGA